MRGFAPGFVNYAVASDKVYQLLARGRWFSLGTPVSSTTKTGRHDIAEILLKVGLKHQKSSQIISYWLQRLFIETFASVRDKTNGIDKGPAFRMGR